MSDFIYFNEEVMETHRKKILEIAYEIKADLVGITSNLSLLDGDPDGSYIYNQYIDVKANLTQCIMDLEDLSDKMKQSAIIFKDGDKITPFSSALFGYTQKTPSDDNDENSEVSTFEKVWKVTKTVAFDIIGGGILAVEGVGQCRTGIGALKGIPMILTGGNSFINGIIDLKHEVYGEWDKVGETDVLDSAIDEGVSYYTKTDKEDKSVQNISNIIQIILSGGALGGIKDVWQGLSSLKTFIPKFYPVVKTTSELKYIMDQPYIVARSAEKGFKLFAGLDAIYNFSGTVLDLDDLKEKGTDFYNETIKPLLNKEDKNKEELETGAISNTICKSVLAY